MRKSEFMHSQRLPTPQKLVIFAHTTIKTRNIMKGKKIIASVFLMTLYAECGNSHQKKETGIITIDVHDDYPEKKLMLQDILEVEYIPLETSDEFITQGYVLDIGDRYILAKNRTPDMRLYREGSDILIFPEGGRSLDGFSLPRRAFSFLSKRKKDFDR